MILVEKHNITKSNDRWLNIDYMCFLSKNLYNFALYTIKKNWDDAGKIIWYNELDKLMRLNENYSLLPNASSQQILMILEKNIKSYLELLKMWKDNPNSLLGMPKFPYYKHKTKGRNIVVITYQHIRLKNNLIYFPKKTGISPIKTLVNGKIKQVRIIPRSGSYKIEVVYEKEINSNNLNPYTYASIDLGVNNLATINKDVPQIINGKPLKSINQYYNKKRAEIQSQLEIEYNNRIKNLVKIELLKNDGRTEKEIEKELKEKHKMRRSTKKLRRLTNKRNNKIEDYLHKSSRFVVDCLVKEKVSDLIVGKNDGWKQNVNIGKKNNQNFVYIPFNKFIHMLMYKSVMEGIAFHEIEESYTSKCSALDDEELCYHEEYVGRRIKRGMFVSKEGIRINADLNGAMNIERKFLNKLKTLNVTLDKEDDSIELSSIEPIQTLKCRGQIFNDIIIGNQVVWPLKVDVNQFL